MRLGLYKEKFVFVWNIEIVQFVHYASKVRGGGCIGWTTSG